MTGVHPEPGLVSVVMPIFNTPEAFLREAIQSVRKQTYPRWELLLVDDGSEASVAAVARARAAEDPGRIRCLSHADGGNHGSSLSRNLGVAQAKGEFIAFLDADDVWLSEKLEEQLRVLARYPQAGMLYGRTLYWYSWNAEAGSTKRDYAPRLGVRSGSLVAAPDMLTYSLRGRIAVPCTCSVILRRSVLLSEPWFEDEFDGLYDDQVLYAKFWCRAPVYVDDRCWDRYRQHPRSMTADGDKSQRHFRSRQAYLAWLADYLERVGIRDRAVWRALIAETRIAKSRLLGSRYRKLRSLAWSVIPEVSGQLPEVDRCPR